MKSAIGGIKFSKTFVEVYVQSKPGDKILDIGCGPADILEFLPSVEYWGFDLNEHYITSARERFSNSEKFFCKKVSRDAIPGEKIFDIILACGIFHHLSDEEAVEMFELANTLLKPGGRFITYDGMFVPNQSYIARVLLFLDRGNFVRTEDQYLKIARTQFTDIQVTNRSDWIWLPYDLLIMVCKK